MEYKDIISSIFEVYNINAKDFAKKINVQRSGISHILSGRNKPSLDFLIKVKDAYPELRWDFLLLGKLPMLQNEILSGPTKENKDSSPTLFELETTETTDAELSEKEEIVETKVAVKATAPDNPLIDSQKTKEIPQASISEATNVQTVKVPAPEKVVEKIVWFYSDGSFRVYNGGF